MSLKAGGAYRVGRTPRHTSCYMQQYICLNNSAQKKLYDCGCGQVWLVCDNVACRSGEIPSISDEQVSTSVQLILS